MILAVLLGYAGCGNNKPPAPDPSEVALEKLGAIWKVGSAGNVTLNGVSKKTDYANFTLTISGTPGATSFGYTTAGRPQLSPWPSSGQWVFGTTIETDIIKDGGTPKELAIHYTVSADQLELTFDYNGPGETRTSQVTGSWVFTLTK